jgi:hypothetical protein
MSLPKSKATRLDDSSNPAQTKLPLAVDPVLGEEGRLPGSMSVIAIFHQLRHRPLLGQ